MIEFPPLPTGDIPMWDGSAFRVGNSIARVIAYSRNLAGWDDQLTALHEAEAGDGNHPIDVASRKTALAAIRASGIAVDGSLLEIGCSSGFLLRDLRHAFPRMHLIGADIVTVPLMRLGEVLHGVPLVQMDLLECPFQDAQFDAVVALNVLEHIEDDVAALKQIVRILKPGGVLIVEVPQGPGLFDYLDTYLRHFRRYGRRELRRKLLGAALRVDRIGAVGIALYPAFAIAKMFSRLRYGRGGERAHDLERLVRKRINESARSPLLKAALAFDTPLVAIAPLLPGIRCTAVAWKPM